LRLVDTAASLRHVALWTVGGAVLWAGLAFLRASREGGSFATALDPVSRGFAPLYLRPALTLLALVSLAPQPSYPYAFTLPVALGQDLGVAQDAATLAVLVAAHAPRLRLPAPGAGALGLIAFIVYALLTPSSARHWDGHPGNEPKTLRMAVAIGHGLTLDVEGVSAAMEALPVRGLGGSVRVAAALVSALFLLVRDATGRPGLSAAMAAGLALIPPFLFYFFQFYPEMLGALALALALRALLFRRGWKTSTAAWMGLLLAYLPW